jgi:hypothetical protein
VVASLLLSETLFAIEKEPSPEPARVSVYSYWRSAFGVVYGN